MGSASCPAGLRFPVLPPGTGSVIESDGSYAIQGVPVGEAKVAVNSPNPNSGDFQPLQREGRPPPPPRPKISGWFPIPAQYQDLAKPRLTYTVKSGPNTFDIELK